MPKDTRRGSDIAKLFGRVPVLAEEVAEHVAQGPITPFLTPGQIRRQLATGFDLSSPVPLEDVLREVVSMLDEGMVQVTHPRYFGLFNPSVTPASVVADALVAAYNPQLAAWSHAPVANEIERLTLDRLMEHLGFHPATSAANFTTGGAEANLTALLVALAHRFPSFPASGARALPRDPVLFVSAESHHSLHKAAQMVGLGREAVRTVPMNTEAKMDPGALARLVGEQRAGGREPFFVVGTAGSTSTGVIDPLEELGAVCRAEQLWFHVDAAWGGAAVLSPKLRPHLAGIELADSITCDAHKWLSVPMAAGMFFCRHPGTVRAAFSVPTPYMPVAATEEVIDQFATTVQWSRRFIGLKLFMSLAEHGVPGYAAMIERQAELGDHLRGELRRRGWSIVNATPLPLVCFTREGLDARRLVDELLRRQVAWMSTVPVDGKEVIRACVTSFRTDRDDIEAVVAAMTRVADGSLD